MPRLSSWKVSPRSEGQKILIHERTLHIIANKVYRACTLSVRSTRHASICVPSSTCSRQLSLGSFVNVGCLFPFLSDLRREFRRLLKLQIVAPIFCPEGERTPCQECAFLGVTLLVPRQRPKGRANEPYMWLPYDNTKNTVERRRVLVRRWELNCSREQKNIEGRWLREGSMVIDNAISEFGPFLFSFSLFIPPPPSFIILNSSALV